MAKISHFVVTYNHETGEFDLDDDTALSVFDNQLVWDDKLEEWYDFESMSKEMAEKDYDASEALYNFIKNLKF